MRRGESGLNLLLGIDKPAGMTSHDVVDAVRRALGERRVGHAGTLDPAATGVMVVGVGQGTRLMGLLTAETKCYLAEVSFGAETDTDDADGRVTRTAEVGAELADAAFAQSALDSFLGAQLQVPPAYSAISVGGRRAYARARSGEDVALEPRPVEVIEAALVNVLADDGAPVVWQCAFTVSKGTYIRALARDIGRSVGSAAHLRQLRRTSSGDVTLAQCATLEALSEAGADGVGNLALDPARVLGLPTMRVAPQEEKAVRSGMALPSDYAEGTRVCMVLGGQVLGVWEARGARLRPVANFPGGITGVRRGRAGA